MKKGRIIVLAITLVFLLCVIGILMDQSHTDLTEELKFSFTIDGNEEVVSCWKNADGEYEAFFPGYVDIGQIKICLSNGNIISVNETEVCNGSYCDMLEYDIPYEVIFRDLGKTLNSKITFRRSGNLASVHIDTESQNLEYLHASKNNKEAGHVRIYTDQGKLNYSGELEHITGRGNSTWLASPKKSYGIKLPQEIDLLEMGTAQKWVVLANAFDESNLKNKLIYDFAQAVGLSYSPDSQWIDLYLNNEYVGLYLLCEKIEVHPERVNIAKEASSLISMEYESRLISQGIPYVATNGKQALRIHYPENPTEQDLENAAKLWQSVENAIISESGVDMVSGRRWDELIDVDSWARKYLIEEIFANLDAAFLSQYFYIDGNNADIKAYAGPVWDYDSTFGSVWQTSAPNSWCANRLGVEAGYEAPWFYRLCQKAEFMEYVATLFEEEFLPVLQEMKNEKIKIYTENIYAAAKMNSIRWNTNNDMDIMAAEMEEFLSARIEFLSDVWLEGMEYVCVKVLPEYGGHYAYIAIKKGETLENLPDMSDSSSFAGWYYSDTNTPIEKDVPILEDVQIYSKWDVVSTRAESRIKQLLPLGIIAIMGIGILVYDICRQKAGRTKL